MNRGLLTSLAVAATAAALVGGVLAWKLLPAPAPSATAMPTPLPAPVAPAMRPSFQLTDTEGRLRDVAEWDGRVLLINFWATWCPPCLREIPTFIELQQAYDSADLQVVGIAIDDLGKVTDFMETLGINYPVLVGETDAIDVGTRFGNRLGALPFSAVVGRDGRVAHVHRGELTLEAARAMVAPLI